MAAVCRTCGIPLEPVERAAGLCSDCAYLAEPVDPNRARLERQRLELAGAATLRSSKPYARRRAIEPHSVDGLGLFDQVNHPTLI